MSQEQIMINDQIEIGDSIYKKNKIKDINE